MSNKAISEVVKVFLDEVLCRVQIETDRIDQIRKIAERVVEELIIEAIEATGKNESGAGDVYRVSEKAHDQNGIDKTQHGKLIEGQTKNRQSELPNTSRNNEQLVSDGNRSRSLSTLPTWLSKKTMELCLQQNTSTEVLCINQQLIPEVNTHPIPDKHRSYNISQEKNDKNEPCLTWESMHPKYAMVKVVKINNKEKIVHSNGVLDNEEVKRIVAESDKILKKKGFIIRARKFIRRMLCCFSAQNED